MPPVPPAGAGGGSMSSRGRCAAGEGAWAGGFGPASALADGGTASAQPGTGAARRGKKTASACQLESTQVQNNWNWQSRPQIGFIR
jgi:hypothetical protein